jgi:hypothetical protein
MKHLLTILSVSLQAVLLAGCQAASTTLTTFDSERDAFVNAQSTWKAGIHTFEDMKRAYGAPNDTAARPEGGFAARWIKTSRVIVAAPSGAYGGTVNEFDSVRFRPHHYTSVTRSLEAFFDATGMLTSFRVNLAEKENHP